MNFKLTPMLECSIGFVSGVSTSEVNKGLVVGVQK